MRNCAHFYSGATSVIHFDYRIFRSRCEKFGLCFKEIYKLILSWNFRIKSQKLTEYSNYKDIWVYTDVIKNMGINIKLGKYIIRIGYYKSVILNKKLTSS